MKTDYQGPTRIETIEVAGRSIRLARPADPDRLLDAPDVLALNARDDYMPYWAYLWPGAFLLAEAVAREPLAPDTRVLEIGCGLGLTGLVAATRGARVVFTDYDDAPLAFAAESARANGVPEDRFAVERFDWRSPIGPAFDTILGADVLYERRLVPLVADVLAARLEADGVALISNPYRVAAESFPEELETRGLRCDEEPIEAECVEFGKIRGKLYRVKRGSTRATRPPR
ncbi:MAG: methyltransferase domain-containing protein [Isosphaeraceae bacterium]|nr:methyltransferase domain-containing protein [Isosphaeraceae bacterium]